MAENPVQHNAVLTCPFMMKQLGRLAHFDHRRHIQGGGTTRALLTRRDPNKFTDLLNLCVYGMSAHGAMDLPFKSLGYRFLHGPSLPSTSPDARRGHEETGDRKSTRLNSSH